MPQTVSLAQLDSFTPNYVSQEEFLTQSWDIIINIAINDPKIHQVIPNYFLNQERIICKQHYYFSGVFVCGIGAWDRLWGGA